MLEEMIGEKIVIDLRSTYVCLGTLKEVMADFLVLASADLHDLRDTETTRVNYIAHAIITGIQRNRKKLWLMRSDIVAIARLSDVVET